MGIRWRRGPNYIRPEFVEGETKFKKAYGAYSNLLLNNGDNTFTDIARKAGVYEQHNTFNAVFVDLSDDGHSDLVVAQDTGMVRIFKNNGDLGGADPRCRCGAGGHAGAPAS